MENESLQENTLEIDSHELLTRFVFKCKKDERVCAADIVSAVYYYRKYPGVNDFITKFLVNNQDYFQIQWVRSTWNKLSQMSQEELSELVINQINLVANSEEEQ